MRPGPQTQLVGAVGILRGLRSCPPALLDGGQGKQLSKGLVHPWSSLWHHLLGMV